MLLSLFQILSEPLSCGHCSSKSKSVCSCQKIIASSVLKLEDEIGCLSDICAYQQAELYLAIHCHKLFTTISHNPSPISDILFAEPLCIYRYNYNFRTNINWLGQTNGYLGKVTVDVEPARLNSDRPECSLNLGTPCDYNGTLVTTMPTVQALDFSVIDFNSFYQNYVGFPPTNAVSLSFLISYQKLNVSCVWLCLLVIVN